MAARKGETTKFRVSVGLYQNGEKIKDLFKPHSLTSGCCTLNLQKK